MKKIKIKKLGRYLGGILAGGAFILAMSLLMTIPISADDPDDVTTQSPQGMEPEQPDYNEIDEGGGSHNPSIWRTYKDFNAWWGENRDHATLLAMGRVQGSDYFIHPMSALQAGIPSGTTVVLMTSNSWGQTSTREAQKHPAAQSNLTIFLQGGGVAIIDMGDNDYGDGYRAPGAVGTPSYIFPDDWTSGKCRDATLNPAAVVANHPIIIGPDGIPGTADDLNNSNIDMAYSCWVTHGNLVDGITLPPDATVIMTATFGGVEKPILAEYCYQGGRVIVETITKEFVAHQPPGYGYTNLMRNLFSYALSPEAVCVPPGRIFPDEAVGLAIDVADGDYLWGGKGYNFDDVKFASSSVVKEEGYWYWNPCKYIVENKCRGGTDQGRGLDCSGLSFWSYNRAYYGNEMVNWIRCAVDDHECPLGWEGANDQCLYNIEDTVGEKKCRRKELNKEELRLGDLLFFDAEVRKDGEFIRYDQDGVVDHVAMHIGEYDINGNGEIDENEKNSVIHAHNRTAQAGITIESLDGLIAQYKDLAGEEVFTRSGHVTEARGPEMKDIASSSVDLIVTDPRGIVISKEDKETIGMSYYEYDIDGDEELDDIVNIAVREIGDYLITVIPEVDALPTETYTFRVEALINGEIVTVFLAEDVPISEIPRTPYIVESTETEIIPIISAFVDFDPDTLNLKSRGQYITVHIELPIGYDINEANLESIKLNDQIPAESEPVKIGDYDDNGIPDLMVKFDRSAVQNILEVGDEVKITITGELMGENPFQGSDIIKVITVGKKVSVAIPLLAFVGLTGLLIYRWKPKFLNKVTKVIKIINNLKNK